MQYYQEPKDLDINSLKENLYKVNIVFDEIRELRILGGEPFMNKNIYEICKYASQLDRIKSIVVFTNGTIVPDEKRLAELDNGKILFYISDYHQKKQKISIVKDMLIKQGFKTYVSIFSDEGWIKHSEFAYHDIPDMLKDRLYGSCEAKKCNSIIGDTFSICEYIANAVRLRAIPFSANNQVYLRGDNYKNIKKNIIKYLSGKKMLDGCHYCSRIFYTHNNAEHVRAGEQTETVLDYNKYDY